MGLSVNILDAADTMMLRKMHRDDTECASRPALCVAFVVGNLRVSRGLPYAALNVGARRFVENTPW